MLNNPIAGGPNFVEVLKNALEQVPNAYAKPPATGGTQISTRFADDRLAILDGICQRSGWNRSQVVNALVDRGLYELFSRLNDPIVEAIMATAANRVVPVFDPSIAIAKELKSFTRFRLHPTPQKARKGQVAQPLDKTWSLISIDPDSRTFTLQDTEANWHLRLHFSHIERLSPDTVADAKDGFKNCWLALNVVVFMVSDKELKLVPLFANEHTPSVPTSYEERNTRP